MKRSFLFYSVVIVVFCLGLGFALERGRHLTPRSTSESTISALVSAPPATTATEPPASLWSAVAANLQEPLSRLFIQLLVILIATWLVRRLFVKIAQPGVVGEMFAGVLLGPSLFGLLFPHGFAFVFPDASLGTLKLLSQIGVCLFMFAIGMDLDVSHLRGQAPRAIVVSHTSILLPYLLGVLASLSLYSSQSGPGTSFVPFALFMGIAMSITAFYTSPPLNLLGRQSFAHLILANPY